MFTPTTNPTLPPPIDCGEIYRAASRVELPTVSVLGLEIASPGFIPTQKPANAAVHYCSAFVLPWKVFPNLQTIRMLLEVDVEELKASKFVLRLVLERGCRNHGLALEDNFGNPITDDSPVW